MALYFRLGHEYKVREEDPKHTNSWRNDLSSNIRKAMRYHTASFDNVIVPVPVHDSCVPASGRGQPVTN